MHLQESLSEPAYQQAQWIFSESGKLARFASSSMSLKNVLKPEGSAIKLGASQLLAIGISFFAIRDETGGWQVGVLWGDSRHWSELDLGVHSLRDNSERGVSDKRDCERGEQRHLGESGISTLMSGVE